MKGFATNWSSSPSQQQWIGCLNDGLTECQSARLLLDRSSIFWRMMPTLLTCGGGLFCQLISGISAASFLVQCLGTKNKMRSSLSGAWLSVKCTAAGSEPHDSFLSFFFPMRGNLWHVRWIRDRFPNLHEIGGNHSLFAWKLSYAWHYSWQACLFRNSSLSLSYWKMTWLQVGESFERVFKNA